MRFNIVSACVHVMVPLWNGVLLVNNMDDIRTNILLIILILTIYRNYDIIDLAYFNSMHLFYKKNSLLIDFKYTICSYRKSNLSKGSNHYLSSTQWESEECWRELVLKFYMWTISIILKQTFSTLNLAIYGKCIEIYLFPTK